jgi:hypothetical protein
MTEIIRKTFKNPFGDVFEAVAVPLETHPKWWVLTIVRNGSEVIQTKVGAKGYLERIIARYEEEARGLGIEDFMRFAKARRDGVWFVEVKGVIYVAGNTYPIKEQLKALGFRWDSGKGLWKANKDDVDIEKLKELGVKEFKGQ